MNLTRLSIARPIFILMLMAAAVLLGTISYFGTRVELNPEVSFPVVTVTTIYPGAGPDEINTLVSRRIEDAVSGVTNLQELSSTSQEGFSTVTASFELGTNTDVALNDVRTRVDAILAQLPDGVERPTISKFDSSSQPVLYLAFASTGRSSQELRDLIDLRVRDRFAQIKGVADVAIQGGDIREIQVLVDKDKLLAYGIGINDIQRQIASSTRNVPGGRITSGDEEYNVRVMGEWKSIEQIRRSKITIQDPSNPQAKATTVTIGDVATVVDSTSERTAYSRLNGKDTVVLAIQKAREGNAIEITDKANTLITQVQKEFPDLSIVKTLEQARQIRESLADLNFTLFFGIFLVALTVFVFLHNLRGTIIVAIAIPVCIFVTFIAVRIAGFTINNMTMLALILAIGVLVDDAIVVLENIFRHLKRGEDPREAALNGRAEIGLAALAITMADVVVFLPIAFMGGIVGQFFKPMALSYVFAVLASLFVSFTITPMLAARWYRKGEDAEHATGWFATTFEKGFSRLERGYGRVLEWALNHRWFVFILGNLALVAIFMFIAGGFAGLSGNPVNAIRPGPAGPPPAIMLFFISVFVGVIVFVVNFLRNLGSRKRAWALYGGAFVVASVVAFSMRMPPLVAIPLAFVVLFIPFAVMNLLQPRSKFRYIASGAAFGLIFPAAALLGGFYGAWKQEAPFKFEFIPRTDGAQINVSIELPPGSSLQATQKVVSYVEGVVSKNPDVKYVLSTVGTSGVGNFAGASQGSNYAQVVTTLYEKGALLDKLPFRKHEERLRWDDDTKVAADLLAQLGRYPGADIRVATGGGVGFGAPIQMSFRSENRDLLVRTVEDIKNRLQAGAVKGVINVDTSSASGKPELQAVPDRARLADAGLSVVEVGAAARTLYQGDDQAKFRVEGKEYDIRVQLSPEDRNNPNILNELPIAFKEGNPIFLGAVTTLQRSPAVDRIQRRDRTQEVQLTADLLPGFAQGTVQQQIDQWIEREQLLPPAVAKAPLGQTQAQQRESGFLFLAFGLGLVLVYMLLASLYDNLVYPLVVQLAQPQALTGAILALVLTDKSLNLVAFIGLITLIGLVGKNAILLVDYTNTLRSRGRNRHDALVEAGPVRLRPISMTTLALVVGTLPIAIAIGRGSEFRETIGIVIIGGITLSTLLTLLVIPCSYTIFDDLSLYFARTFGRKREEPPSLQSPDPTPEEPRVPVEV